MIAKRFIIPLIALLGASCSALSSPDPAATLQANNAAIQAEGTSIAQAVQAQATEVRATVSAAETYVAQGEQINDQLLLTMRSVLPPTDQVVQNQGGFTPGHVASPAPPGSFGQATSLALGSTAQASSSTLFTQVGTAETVRDSDGCADSLVSVFPADIQRIYVTARALNISAGTVMRVQWNYEGEPSFEETYTVSVNDDDFCLWFYIEPVADVFGAGNWSVQLFADDRPIDPAVSFTIGM